MNIYKTLNSADANLQSEHDWSVTLQTRFGTMSLSKNLINGLAPEGSTATVYMEALDYVEQVCVYAWRAYHKIPTKLEFKRNDAIAKDVKLATAILEVYCENHTIAKRTARLTTLVGAIMPLVRNFDRLRQLRKTNKEIGIMVLPFVTASVDAHVIELLEQDVYPTTLWHDARLVKILTQHIDFSEGVNAASIVSNYCWIEDNFANTLKLTGEANFAKMVAEAMVDGQNVFDIYSIISSDDIHIEIKDAVFLKWAESMIAEITCQGIADVPYNTLDVLEYAMESDFKRESNVPAVWNLAYLLGVFGPDESEPAEIIEKIRRACIDFLGDDDLIDKITNECVRQGFVLPKATIMVKESDKDDFMMPPAEVVELGAEVPNLVDLAVPTTTDDGMNQIREQAVATDWQQPESTAPALTLKWELPLSLGKTPEMIDLECSMLELHATAYRVRNVYHMASQITAEAGLPNIGLSLVMIYAATRNNDIQTVWQGDTGLFNDMLDDSRAAEMLQELDALLERFRCDADQIIAVHGDEVPSIRNVIGSIHLSDNGTVPLWINA